MIDCTKESGCFMTYSIRLRYDIASWLSYELFNGIQQKYVDKFHKLY